MEDKNYKTISILTSCEEDWGGSEELWAKCIPMLDAVKVTVYKKNINPLHPEFVRLADLGMRLVELNPDLSKAKRTVRKFKQLMNKALYNIYVDLQEVKLFQKSIKQTKPDLVVISQGINFDGLIYAYQCLICKIPYVIIAQKAVDFYWPNPDARTFMKETLLNAEMCFFVSNHNKKLTEEQFGMHLKNSKVIFNPVKTSVNPLPFPSAANGYHLACVARLFIIDKGQDILLRIMAKDKWKQRNLSVSFIGTGVDEHGLKEMAELLGLKNVHFKGHESNIESSWLSYHALVLPSRSEGLPLAMIEAMSVGRPVIVSNAGGNEDVIIDGLNGFIADATEKDFEAAMERAWNLRDEWKKIGENASAYVADNIPDSPERDFADELNNILHELQDRNPA
ncbi:glycosyltransferase [Pedobacter heparinus]|uniref:glycosyltransferase n=1 Tax=Pedobacter heparinus TaxID=984 RepID=UPI0029308353|nr:glycosyltransferase [Pedobacter heparinus]